jgi:hypothetical protein
MFGPLPSGDTGPTISVSPHLIMQHEKEQEAKRLKAEAEVALAAAQRAAQV